MKVTLIKDFGINKKGETMEVNEPLYKHLLAKGCIKVDKPKAEKK